MAEYELTLSHNVILTDSFTQNVKLFDLETVVSLSQSTDDIGTNIDTVISILQTYSTNIRLLDISTVVTFDHSFGGNNTVIDWITTMVLLESWVYESLQTQDDSYEDSIGFDHILVVTQDVTKTISTTVNVKSEFGLFKTTVSDDYANP